MSENGTDEQIWWGRYEIPDNMAGHWQVGALRLWVEHRRQEWMIATEQSEDPLDDNLFVACPIEAEPVTSQQAESESGRISEVVRDQSRPRDVTPLPWTETSERPESNGMGRAAPAAEVYRFAAHRTQEVFWLVPRLADRSVVARPEIPFHLLPGEEIRLYLSTAIWIQLEVGEPPRRLLETPTFRPSDTWFGPSTREGELCYASRTSARINLDRMLRHPGRAITSVLLRNRAQDNLLLERISLPVPALSLFHDAEGSLWTEAINLEREKSGNMARIRLTGKAPAEAIKPAKVSDPRVPQEQNVLVKAIHSLMR